MVAAWSHERHVILQQCLVVLVELARQLQTKSGSLSHQLQAKSVAGTIEQFRLSYQ